MRTAIVEELKPPVPYQQGNYMHVIKAAVMLTTPGADSPPDWVHRSVLGRSGAMAPSLSRVSKDAEDVLYSCLEEVGACLPCLLEFASKQGEALLRRVFLRCVEELDMPSAVVAVTRLTGEKGGSVSKLASSVQTKALDWMNSTSHATPIHVKLLRLSFMEILFVPVAKSSLKIESGDTAKILLCLASLQMNALGRLGAPDSVDVLYSYLETLGMQPRRRVELQLPALGEEEAPIGVDVVKTMELLARLSEDVALLNPDQWTDRFGTLLLRGIGHPSSSQLHEIISLTFFLLLKFPTFTEGTVRAVATKSADLSSARHRLGQMKKCVDTLFSSQLERSTPRGSSFAHLVLAHFFVAHGRRIAASCPSSTDCWRVRDVVDVMSLLATHVVGNFILKSRFVNRLKLEVVLDVPTDVLSLLTRSIPIDPSVFSPMPLSAADNVDTSASVKKWVAQQSAGCSVLCLDDSAGSLTIASILFEANPTSAS